MLGSKIHYLFPWDYFRALVPIGTKSQIWDIITSTVLVIWIFSFPRPNFPKPRPRLFSETKFFRNRNRDFFSETKFSKTETETFFRDQIFRNRDRDFFRDQIFLETETETLFPKPNFPKPKPKPSKIWQKFRNREVSKPKCQSLVLIKFQISLCRLCHENEQGVPI